MGAKKLLGLIVMGAAIIGTSSAALAGKSGGSKPAAVTSTITLNQGGGDAARVVGTLAFGSGVTFATTIEPLSGKEWPMVYLECRSVNDGSVLYGQLDYPSTTFVLGGGSSPWWSVQSDADCTAQLMAYSKSAGAGRLLAQTESFYVAGWVAA